MTDAKAPSCSDCEKQSQLAACEKQRDNLAYVLARYSRMTNRAAPLHTKEYWIEWSTHLQKHQDEV